MNTFAFSLLAVLSTSVSAGNHAPRPAMVLAAEPDDSRYPRPRVSPGDVSGDTPKAPPRMLEGVSLNFVPTEDLGPYLSRLSGALAGKKVSVAMFGDERPPAERSLIGKTARGDKPVTTEDDVGGWSTLQLLKLLKRSGVQVVSTGADLAVSGSVRRFFVDEGDDYVSTVILDLAVADARGTELWKGTAQGNVSKWGRSYKLENYLEALSNSFVRAVDAWVTDPRFAAVVPR